MGLAPANPWLQNGRLKCAQSYSGGRQDGVSSKWYEDGSLKCVEMWRQGRLIHTAWGDETDEDTRERVLAAWKDSRQDCLQLHGLRVLTFITNGMSAKDLTIALGKPDEEEGNVFTYSMGKPLQIPAQPEAIVIEMDPSNRVTLCRVTYPRILFYRPQ